MKKAVNSYIKISLHTQVEYWNNLYSILNFSQNTRRIEESLEL